jgi:glucose dehydrogenase
MFRTSDGIILRHADKLTHLDKNGKQLWQLDITKGGSIDMSYRDKNQKKPYLVISNDQSVIDRYLQ